MLKFTKMQGLGNDYIYFDCTKKALLEPEKVSIRLSDRHFGVGGDGIVMILPSETADFRMRMFNADGSEGKMCGNAIRCIGKYGFDRKLTEKTKLEIETLSGIKYLDLHVLNGAVESVTVNMGAAQFKAEKIPVISKTDEVVSKKLTVGDTDYKITAVSMGNPHAVVYCENPKEINLPEIGPLFENNPIFPEQVNTEFVHVTDKSHIEMRVWERGSGETLACGTGACANVAACVKNGFCNKDEDVFVKLLGGTLKIKFTDDAVYMTGQAGFRFDGECEE